MIGKMFSKRLCRAYSTTLNESTIARPLIRTEYAVRGAIADKAATMKKQMEQGIKFPFDKITHLNVGNPQDLGQKPITFNREVLASCLTDDPERNRMIYSADAVDRADFYYVFKSQFYTKISSII